MNQIETERLLLRPMRETDAPRLVKLANRPEIAHMLATMPHPYSLSDAEDFLDNVRKLPSNAANFAITLKDAPDTLIGGTGYGPASGTDKPPHEIDFGYWLGLEYWGKGYATEAAKAVIRHAFEVSSIEQIDTEHLTVNPASGRVLAKAGFVDKGERTCYSQGSGQTRPSRKMVLSKARYQERKG
ncbi:MAG: GNAT family N-acetyltransferase [Anderseniella sp.]|nr:GNAT family N-acetyltransferase [Anderseniella sp.]